MNPELKNLLVSDILVRFCEQIPYAFAVVWAMKTIASPVTTFSSDCSRRSDGRRPADHPRGLAGRQGAEEGSSHHHLLLLHGVSLVLLASRSFEAL